MANVSERWEDNVPGKYYVDKSCILCNLCSEIAPNNFAESEDGDHNIVSKQPENEEEEAQMKESIEQCPTESIGDDGA
jgi:ferredoxin